MYIAAVEREMHKYLRCLVTVAYLAALSLYAVAADAKASDRGTDMQPTPVTGESWLNHLHRPFGFTSMGKTGHLGPAPPESGDDTAGWQLGLLPDISSPSVTLHGSDLYRLNCQGCHGESGEGAPPEINSIINPVRATSVSLVMQRMKDRGLDMNPAEASELAKQSKAALLERLHTGGQDMPAFPHLSEEEINAIVAYCHQLAGIPGAQNTQLTVRESPLRVGEHIVKSTCHTCHDAVGPNPSAAQLEEGAIPPLSTLTTRTDQLELIRKVTSGAPIVMGTPPTPHRGRMPVFYYLSKQEAADVYLYLTQYPPEEISNTQPLVAASGEEQPQPTPAPSPLARPGGAAKVDPANQSQPVASSKAVHVIAVVLVLALGMFIVLLMLGGLGLAVCVFLKLWVRKERQPGTVGTGRVEGNTVRPAFR
jgi:mono/diheme cytochrome c family protein